MRIFIWAIISLIAIDATAQGKWDSKFEQLGTMLPTPNKCRNASGAPGVDYWQQKADYDIEVSLDDFNQSINGKETITYFNQSPDNLEYLWVQLDQNVRSEDSNTPLVTTKSMKPVYSGKSLLNLTGDDNYNGGFKIKSVTDQNDHSLQYVINKTMMRIDLPRPLAANSQITFNISWSYNINDRMVHDGRSGYEYFPENDNYIYAIAQWFPRMAVYNDVEGWQNKQFLGNGEFALAFGNYKVKITVPADHMVGATGELKNAKEVLSPKEYSRLKKARKTFDRPVVIRSQKEAVLIEKSKTTEKKTWEFYAENVRDFAFTSSRKFLWDAMAVDINGKTPLAMSYYPKEGNPLWERESTKAVANTLKTFSNYTIDYPYPTAISVHTAAIGMEYPMICFNYGRPNEDGSYSNQLEEGMVGVIVHEVGHNYFPMIVNSDERQWSWMDEGLDTFLEHMTLVEHYPDFNLTWGTPQGIVPYMKGEKERRRPIMVNSEQILQFGYNAYGKPSAGLVMLRETIMGPELFDHAFKIYAKRWAFKHPSPADFFRTMEDASAMDLDWFWKGWFYTTDNVDLSIDKVKWYKMQVEKKPFENKIFASQKIRGKSSKERRKEFGKEAQTFVFKKTNSYEYREFENRVDDESVKMANKNRNFYEVTFKNNGGMVMPIILEWTFVDGSKEIEKIPAEIWRLNEIEVTKVFAKNKEVINILIDPNMETADTNTSDNVFPRVGKVSKFDRFTGG